METLKTPVERTVVSAKKVAAAVGKEFKADAKAVTKYLEGVAEPPPPLIEGGRNNAAKFYPILEVGIIVT